VFALDSSELGSADVVTHTINMADHPPIYQQARRMLFTLHPESKEKTAFTTWSGLYQFVVMPFGLCNAPATFQRLMETVLTGLTRHSCMVYLDEFLVIGATFQDHLENLQKVFARLRVAGLCLKPQKCSFAKREVTYLGYVVSSDGIYIPRQCQG